uniref:Uncharacterized protein n=3 Tax=Octopus bimaculoides TaxID=37653 RepID=A0A0L8H6D7_OCTBM
MEQNNTKENDLPLMANIDTYCVQHYVLDLTCDFSKNILSGSTTLFVNRVKSDPVKSHSQNDILQTKKRKHLITDQIITEKKQKNCTDVSKCSESNSNKLTDSLNSDNVSLDEEHSSFLQSEQYLKDCNETESNIATHDITRNNEKMSIIPKLGTVGSSQINSSCLEEEILPADITSNDKNVKEIIASTGDQRNLMTAKNISKESTESVNSFTICHLEQKQFTKVLPGNSDVNLQTVEDGSNQYNHSIFILDACDIIVSEVTLLPLLWCDKCQNKCFKECETGADSSAKREEFYHQCSLKIGKEMSFKNDKWSLRVFEKDPTEEFCLNSKFAIKIKYSTHAKGKSLKWVPDQDGNMCMFTCGHWINNRSLFPSQDHSEALSTWQAYVTVENIHTVIMTGDKEPLITNTENGKFCYFYQSTMLLPSSTLAIAVGQWEHATITHLMSTYQDSQQNQKWVPEFCASMHGSCSVNYSKTPVPCRVFAPRSLILKAESEFKSYLPKCLTKACSILGPYPFRRLDILITPSCFSCLGLTR